MLASDFYKIINSENSRVKFLQNHGLLPKEYEINNYEKCGGATKMCVRKKSKHLERRGNLNLSGA